MATIIDEDIMIILDADIYSMIFTIHYIIVYNIYIEYI